MIKEREKERSSSTSMTGKDSRRQVARARKDTGTMAARVHGEKEKDPRGKAKASGNHGKEKEKERTSTDGHENLTPPTGPELTSGQCTSRNATDMHHMEKDSEYSREEWDGQTPTMPRDQTDQYVDSL